MSSDPATTATSRLYHDFVLPCYGRFDLCLERGSGCRVWAEDGREYLDFGAGIAVCSLGHCHPAVTRAVTGQAGRLVHTSNLYHTRPQAELARRLVGLVGAPGRVFFCNSGAEANEGLIKLARKFGAASGGRFRILTFENSFHGRTMAGISATGQEKVKKGFAPLLDGFTHLPFGDLNAVAGAVDEHTVAILVEPVQGEGGIHPATPAFLAGLQRICRDHNLLLLFDEVQCGLGRTGDWCAWKTIAGESVTPDGVSWAKGIANGFPLGAVWIGGREVPGHGGLWELLGPGSHGTTYGGNPVACAAGLAVLDTIEQQGLLQRAREAGRELADGVRAFAAESVAAVRAIGLMLGIELQPGFPSQQPAATGQAEAPALAATKLLQAEGMLVIPAGERTIRLLPPLNVGAAEIREALDKLGRVLLTGR